MTPEQQRVAIAEACGFIPNTFETPTHDFKGPLLGYRKAGGPNEWVPDYLNDLNAMHEAEEWLGNHSKHLFIAYGDRLNSKLLWASFRATAAQRAEAFLKTVGKWVEA